STRTTLLSFQGECADARTRRANRIDVQLRVAGRSGSGGPPAAIMAGLGNTVDVQATTLSSPQLEMTSFATDSTVAPGTHFSLALDPRPARGVHVYAPGVTGYKSIALSVQPQAGLLTRGGQYPPSEDYHFKPLNEHVQVYQRPFRIVQDVLIDPSP